MYSNNEKQSKDKISHGLNDLLRFYAKRKFNKEYN